MICPWIDEMIREPGLLDATEDLLGPDLLCWGTSLRAKAADGKTFAAGISTLRTPTSSRSC